MTAAERANGRAWVRLKLTFTDAVMDERGLPPIVFKVAAALARYAEAETGIVDRSQGFLADKVETTTRSLQSAIDILVTRGYVVKIRPGGPRLGVKYRLGLPYTSGDENAFTKPASPKGDPAFAKPASPNEPSLTNSGVDFSEAGFASSPVYDSRQSSSRPAQRAEATAEAGTRTMIGVADDGLLDQVRTAIERTGGSLAKRRHNLQPVRDLIAGGVPRGLAVAVIADRAAALAKRSGPLGNLDAAWLLDCIRDRAAADGYGTGSPAEASTAEPADTGTTVAIPGHATTRWPVDHVQRWSARWWSQRRDWPHDALGEPPDRLDPRRSPDFQAALDAGRAEVVDALAAWRGNAAAWDVGRLGPRPDGLASRLGPDFGVEVVTLRHGCGSFTALALDLHLRRLASDFPVDWEREMAGMFRALPSPSDAEDCALPADWQIKALEYREEQA